MAGRYLCVNLELLESKRGYVYVCDVKISVPCDSLSFSSSPRISWRVPQWTFDLQSITFSEDMAGEYPAKYGGGGWLV